MRLFQTCINTIYLMVHNMLFSLVALEIPAVSKGAISIECPGEVYSQLSWSDWSSNLPSEWTMFLPLNSRYIPLHDRKQDDDGIGNGSGNGNGNDADMNEVAAGDDSDNSSDGQEIV
eukprot:447987_1